MNERKKISDEILKMYAPNLALGNLGIASIVLARHYDALHEQLNISNKLYEKYKERVIREFSSNNWLKMHGYPMRRKKVI